MIGPPVHARIVIVNPGTCAIEKRVDLGARAIGNASEVTVSPDANVVALDGAAIDVDSGMPRSWPPEAPAPPASSSVSGEFCQIGNLVAPAGVCGSEARRSPNRYRRGVWPEMRAVTAMTTASGIAPCFSKDQETNIARASSC